MSDAPILIVSDVHAGYEASRVDELVPVLRERLEALKGARLVLLGDILELWRVEPEAALSAAAPLFDLVRRHLSGGGTVDYVLGNHDHALLSPTDGAGLRGRLPDGIRYWHRYLIAEPAGHRVLLTHGDDCDFLYLTLEVIDPLLPGDLRAAHVYRFYEWMYRLDKAMAAEIEKGDLRGLFLAYLNVLRRGGDGSAAVAFAASDASGAAAASVSVDTDAVITEYRRLRLSDVPVLGDAAAMAADALPMAVGVSSVLRWFGLDAWLSQFARVDLPQVRGRTQRAQTWGGIPNYAPIPHLGNTAAFGEPWAHIVVGHFHDPRQSAEARVTDAGSWVRDPKDRLASGTHVEIVDGVVALYGHPSGVLRCPL